MDLSDIKQFSCQVCFEDYCTKSRQPKFLSCFHTVCQPCLQSMIDYSGSGVTCPYCQKVMHVQDGDTGNLQTNFYITEILEKLSDPEVCAKHKRQPNSFFCNTCEVTICRDCTVLDHAVLLGHNLRDITKIKEEKCLLFNEEEENSKIAMESINTTLLKINDKMEAVSISADARLKAIDLYFLNITEYFETEQTELQEKVSKWKEDNTDALENIKQYLTSKSEIISNTVTTFADKQERVTIESVIKSTNILKEIDEEVNKYVENMNLDETVSSLEDNFALKSVQKAVENFASFLKTRIEFTDQEVTAFFPSKFAITLKNDNMKFKTEDISVTIKDQKSEELPNSVKELPEGKYEVCFNPQTKDNISVEVKLQKAPLYGSSTEIMPISPGFKIGRH